jgi:DNA-binding transcriptional LysR family regulator
VRLTAAGEVFANYVRRTVADLETVGSQIESLRGLVRGKVRVATVESAAGEFLSRVIREFQKSHPGVEFLVTVGTPNILAAALLDDSADVLITHDVAPHKDITVLSHAPQVFCALVAKGHPLATRRSLRLRDCEGYPIALADESLAGRALIEQAMATGSFRFQPALISNSVATMKAYARSSQAICFQFGIGCVKEVESGEMVAVPLSDPGLRTAELILVMRRERVLPAAAAAFVEAVRAALHKLAET